MNDEKQEEYIYHNGIAYATDEDEKNRTKEEKRRRRGNDYRFTGLQAAVCVLAILAVLLCKALKNDWYLTVRDWYRDHINRSILIEYDPDTVKREFRDLFGSKEDDKEDGSKDGQTESEGNDVSS